MAQFFGYLILISALVAFVYLIRAQERPPGSKVTLIIGFATVGLALVLSPRLAEFALPQGISFKFQQATIDAKAIKDLRKSVEQTSQEVEAIKQEASTRLNAIEGVQREVEENVAKLRAVSDFTMMLSRAQNDDRIALSGLLKIAQDPKNVFSSVAVQSLRAIKDDVSGNNMIVPGITWKEGHSLQDYPYTKLRQLYAQVPPSHRLDLLSQVWGAPHYSLFEKLDFLMEAIKNTRSTKELQRACQLVNQEAKLNVNFLDNGAYLDWWHQNRNAYLNAKPSSD